MTPHRLGRNGAAIVFLIGIQASAAFAQGSDHDREACTPDVFRLCGAYIPDSDRITDCLRASGPRLSPACHDVFYPPQRADQRPAAGERRRFDHPPRFNYPPPRNDDDF